MMQGVKSDLFVFAGLLMLLIMTVVGSYWPLGEGLLIWSLAISSLKAYLIIRFYMNFRAGDRATKLFPYLAGVGLFILLLLVSTDFLTR